MSRMKLLAEFSDCYRLDDAAFSAIVQNFNRELTGALAGKKTSVSALPSYLTAPTGRETGSYTVIDIGGSNVRIGQIKLLGAGQFKILSHTSKPLPRFKDPGLDAQFRGGEIFDYVAKMAVTVLQEYDTEGVGLTFSYPMIQHSVSKATLLSWTKELRSAGSLGKDIGVLLGKALAKRGVKTKPSVIINDTVAAYFAAAYKEAGVCAASVCGTGYNNCLLSGELLTVKGHPMLINTESGNFSLLASNVYDRTLDQQSARPGAQLLEKMVAGQYLGELLRLTLKDAAQKNLVQHYHPKGFVWQTPYILKAEIISLLLTSGKQADTQLKLMLSEIDLFPTRQNIAILTGLSGAILERAVKIIAAVSLAVLKEAKKRKDAPQILAVDGALFKHAPGFFSGVDAILRQRLERDSSMLQFVPEGSSIGAAIAAAQVA